MEFFVEKIWSDRFKRAILLIIVFVLIYAAIKHLPFLQEEGILSKIIDALFLSFLVTFMYIIPEKMGVAINLSDSVSTQVKGITDKVKTMLFSRTEYGLSGIDEQFDEKYIINNLQKGDKIMWMNTRLSDFTDYKPLFVNAAKRGAYIKILLMSVDSETAKFRWKEAFSDESFDNYVRRLRVQEESIAATEREAGEKKSQEEEMQKSGGKLKIKFYKDLPCVPMIIVSKKNSHKVAYTGFYLNEPSGSTPYLEWETSPKRPLVNKFEEYFHHKWASVSSEEGADDEEN